MSLFYKTRAKNAKFHNNYPSIHLHADPPPPACHLTTATLADAMCLDRCIAHWPGILSAFDHQRAQAPRLLLSGPKIAAEQHFVTAVERAIDDAKEQVWLMVYVLRPDRTSDGPVHRLVAALARAKQRGCDVRVVLDQSKAYQSDDLDPKHVAGADMLRQAGVPVLIDELRVRSHAKMLLIDHQLTIVGSHNWTYSALTFNRESSIMLSDDAVARQVRGIFTTIEGWNVIPASGD